MTRDLSRLLRPRTIAVLGSVWAENVIAQCDKIGFAGDVWPVHPTRASIGGRACYAALTDLPSAPDMTFIGVNRHATLDVVAQLAAMGAGGAICFASGWAETGDNDLQDALVAAAGEMPVLGPNCYGLLNMLDGAVVWPDQHGGVACESGVAILSQSSNIAINLTMQARGLPIAYVACLGNAAQTGLVELADAMLADARVTALGVYAEGINDAAALAALAAKARAAGKGIVMLKSGRSDAGAAAAASHTAALSGSHAASQAYLAQAGIGSVSTLAGLIEALKILHVHGPLPGRRVISLSCSGGEAGLVADLAEGSPLAFAPLSGAQETALGAVLGPLVTLANPLDYHTFIWGDSEKTTAVFSEALAPYDAGLFVIDPPRSDRCDPASFEPAIEAIQQAGRATGKPAFVVGSLPENIAEDRAAALLGEGIVSLGGIETALEAIAGASPIAPTGWQPWPVAQVRGTAVLDEATGKALLAEIGVTIPRGVHVPTIADLIEADLAPPLALKGLGFAHKTEAGAVRLNVTDLRNAADMPGATGYLAEEMVQGAVAELIVSVQRDPVYGATMMLGFGGLQAELLQDTQTMVLPVTDAEITAALSRLKLAPLLSGYRGKPAADVAAIVATALALQTHLDADATTVEIEINPLMATPHGAIAVDALITKESP